MGEEDLLYRDKDGSLRRLYNQEITFGGSSKDRVSVSINSRRTPGTPRRKR